jgi:hypothetical protein
MVAVILFPLTHFLDDLGIDLCPQIVSDRVLVCYVIIAQYTHLLQLFKPADDLLKGAINDGTCIKISALVSCNAMSSISIVCIL